MRRCIPCLPPLLLLILIASACGTSRFAAGPSRQDWFHGQPLYEVHPRGYAATGDLAGITRDLGRLQDLGVRTLVIAPVFPTGTTARQSALGNLYSVRDHRTIDPAVGGETALRELVRAAHRRGLAVLLDVPLPLAAHDHLMAASHPDWLCRDENGQPTCQVARWQGVADVQLDDPAVQDYLVGSLAHWLTAVEVDGFRFPLASLAPMSFWQLVATRLRAENPEVVLVAEATSREFLEVGFDAIYATILKVQIDEARMDDFVEPLELENMWSAATTLADRSPPGTTAITYLEDHFSLRTPHMYPWPTIRGYAAYLFTLPGTPQILMGQEAGTRVQVESSSPYTLDWDDADPRYTELYGTLARLRATNETLRRGDLARVEVILKDAVMYTRSYRGETILCAVNFSEGLPAFPLPDALRAERWHELQGDRFAADATVALPDTVVLGPHEFRIWRSAGR